MTIDIKMLCSFIKDGVGNNVKSCINVMPKGNRSIKRNTKIIEKRSNPFDFSNDRS